MKAIFLISIAILMAFSVFSQQQPETQTSDYTIHSPGDISISLSVNKIMNAPFGSEFAGGIKIRMFLGKRISFDADLAAGKDYIHLGPGIIGLPLWIGGVGLRFLGNISDSFALFLCELAAMALSAEHIAYHFPAKNNTDIAPFISILRLKQLNINTPVENNYAHASFVAGLEINKYFKRFVLSPYAEYNIAYDGYFRGFNFGINFGYYIPRNQK